MSLTLISLSMILARNAMSLNYLHSFFLLPYIFSPSRVTAKSRISVDNTFSNNTDAGAGVQLGGRGEASPAFIFEIKKSALILEKNTLILRVSKRKNSNIFPCGAFFSWLFNKTFIEVP